MMRSSPPKTVEPKPAYLFNIAERKVANVPKTDKLKSVNSMKLYFSKMTGLEKYNLDIFTFWLGSGHSVLLGKRA